MTDDIVVFGAFNGVAIQARPSDRYIDVTAMCLAHGREWHRYARLESAKRFLKALSSSLQIPVAGLIVEGPQGPEGRQGHAFAHRRVALHCAAWISSELEQWVYQKIEELMTTGRAAIAAPPLTRLQYARVLLEQMEAQEKWLTAVEPTPAAQGQTPIDKRQ